MRANRVKCALCIDHCDDDVGYVFCPLLRKVICFACCMEVSNGAEDTRRQITERFDLTEEVIDAACEKCRPRWVRRPVGEKLIK